MDTDIRVNQPGQVVLFGSGETSPSGRKIFEHIFQSMPFRPRIAILETPAGFELNSHDVAGRIAAFITHSLQNYMPQVDIVSARKLGTKFSPDNPEIAAPILSSNLIFMGPGSPTYAVRQLKDTLAWDYVLARHMLGAVLALASSAVVAIGSLTLPVYEIYKVGEDPHWKNGLDFFSGINKNVIFVPHWDNQDGGTGLDTSCCYMGKARFADLLTMLPADTVVIGIDEQTALLVNFEESTFQVLGKGTVTIISPEPGPVPTNLADLGEVLGQSIKKRKNYVSIIRGKSTLTLDTLIPRDSSLSNRAIPKAVWLKAQEVNNEIVLKRENEQSVQTVSMMSSDLPVEILKLLEDREMARGSKDWKKSDEIRNTLNELGWDVVDTLDGQKVIKRKKTCTQTFRRDECRKN